MILNILFIFIIIVLVIKDRGYLKKYKIGSSLDASVFVRSSYYRSHYQPDNTLTDVIKLANRVEQTAQELLKKTSYFDEDKIQIFLRIIYDFKKNDIYELFKYENNLSKKQCLELKYAEKLFTFMLDYLDNLKDAVRDSLGFLDQIEQKHKILNTVESKVSFDTAKSLLKGDKYTRYQTKTCFKNLEKSLLEINNKLLNSINNHTD